MEPSEDFITQPKPTIWYRVARLLPAVVAVLSILALPSALATLNYIELAMIPLGLIGTSLYYYYKHRHESVEPAFTIFWVWALVQLPNLLLATPQGRQPLWDTDDFLGLRFYMGFNTNGGNHLQIGFNILPIVYFAWLRRLRIAENFGE